MKNGIKAELTRREFLTWAGLFCAAFSVPTMGVSEVAKALESGLAMHPVLWIQGGSCSGCSVSLLNCVDPDIKKILLDPVVPSHQLSVQFHQTIMAAEGDVAISALREGHKKNKGKYVLVVEGNIATADHGAYCDFGLKDGKPVSMVEWTETLARDAMAVIALGSCAAYGGIPSGAPNPTEGMGVIDFLKDKKIKTPVINIPGCPTHPDWLVLAIAHVLVKGLPKASDLDEKSRMKQFFGETVHDRCPRLKYFEEGVFAEKFGDEGCLVMLGCKGPMAMADCPTRKWNNGVSFCIDAGAPCLACVEPGFPDESGPFYGAISEETMIRLGIRPAGREVKRNA
ncbi:MAG TPA: hydrogenase small subunit [bacterium]|nr:hydrogenase small subunit [bacterium]